MPYGIHAKFIILLLLAVENKSYKGVSTPFYGGLLALVNIKI